MGRRARAAAAGRRFARVALATTLATLLASTPAAGHRLKESLTTIEVNARTQLVEIVHRYYVHDAEHAVSQLAGLSGDIRSDEMLQQAFGRYVARQFGLADADRTPLALDLLGVELEGPYLWVYQEMPAAHFGDIAYVRHRAMQDVWSDQVNQVNVKRDAGVRTLFVHYNDNLVVVPPPAAETEPASGP